MFRHFMLTCSTIPGCINNIGKQHTTRIPVDIFWKLSHRVCESVIKQTLQTTSCMNNPNCISDMHGIGAIEYHALWIDMLEGETERRKERRREGRRK